MNVALIADRFAQLECELGYFVAVASAKPTIQRTASTTETGPEPVSGSALPTTCMAAGTIPQSDRLVCFGFSRG